MFTQKAIREALFQLIFIIPWAVIFHLSYLALDFRQCSGSLLTWFKIIMIYYFFCIASVFGYVPCRIEILKRTFTGRNPILIQFLVVMQIMSTVLTGFILFIGYWISYVRDTECAPLHLLTRFHMYFHLVQLFMGCCLCTCLCVVDVNAFLRNFAPRTWILYYIS